MGTLQTLAGQASWATKNLAYNLDFIPDEKLVWKPAGTARSALEIVGHLLGTFAMATDQLKDTGQEMLYHKLACSVSSRNEAKIRLISTGEEYSYLLFSLKPEILTKVVELPFGRFPLSFVAAMPVMDAVHHHGQIAYIQILLGDAESHFDFSLIEGIEN